MQNSEYDKWDGLDKYKIIEEIGEKENTWDYIA